MGFTIPCFTTPCFVLKNTFQLRKKLEELGYYLHPECIDDDRGNYLFVNREYYLNRPLGYLEELSRSIDCGANEELFLSIASLRDDTDKYQWFTDGDKWIMCPEIKFSTYWAYNDIDVNTDTIHKATVEELIEHFKGKEE